MRASKYQRDTEHFVRSIHDAGYTVGVEKLRSGVILIWIAISGEWFGEKYHDEEIDDVTDTVMQLSTHYHSFEWRGPMAHLAFPSRVYYLLYPK